MDFYRTSRCYNPRTHRALERMGTHPAKGLSCLWSFYGLVYGCTRLCSTSPHRL